MISELIDSGEKVVLGRIPSSADNDLPPSKQRLLDAVLCALNALPLLANPTTGQMAAEDVQAWHELADLRDRILSTGDQA